MSTGLCAHRLTEVGASTPARMHRGKPARDSHVVRCPTTTLGVPNSAIVPRIPAAAPASLQTRRGPLRRERVPLDVDVDQKL